MLIRMAWRNLWRNGRRTMLTVAAISLGLALLITMVSFVVGMQEMMVEQVARSSIGHIQVVRPDYLKKKRVGLVFPAAKEITETLEGLDDVKAASPRLRFSGAIQSSNSPTMQVVDIMAVDPKREAKFSALVDKVVAGGFVVPPKEATEPDAPARYRNRKGILLGAKLASLLKVELGSKVRVDTAGLRGGTVSGAFYVTGIVKTGADSFDRSLAIVDIDAMRALANTKDTAHEIAVMVKDPSDIAGAALRIRDGLNPILHEMDVEHPGTLVAVAPWWEVSPEIKAMVDMSQSWSSILYLFMLVILSAGVLTTVYMMIYERRREFGIQLAVGERPMRLFASVMLESFFMGTLSVAVGVLFGAIGAGYFHYHGLDLRFLLGGFDIGGLFMENVYRGSIAPRVFIEPSVVVFIGTILFALWPSMKVARMKALDGIQQGAAQ